MSTTPAARRRRSPRASRPAGESPVAAVPDPVSIPDLFRKGRSIAQIARDQKTSQDAVRRALDAESVDYGADKNAKAVGSAPKADAPPKAPKGEWTLLGSYRSILGKPQAAAGSKRAQVVADLQVREEDVKAIVADLAGATGLELALRVNALNAALSAHYARV